MSIEASQLADLEHLRLATQLSGVVTWKIELVGDLASHGYLLAVHAEDRRRVQCEIETFLAGQSDRYESEHRSLREDGAVRWVRARGAVIRDDAGRPIRIVGSSQDVQELKDAHEQNARMVEQMAAANELSGVSWWNWDIVDGDMSKTVLRVGRMVLDNLGYPAEHRPQTMLDSIKASVHSEDQPRVIAAFQACLDGTAPHFDVEYRVIHVDGSVRWKLGRGLVIRDASGRPACIGGTSLDVTRLKQFEEDARAAAEQLQLATQHSGVTTWGFELAGADMESAHTSAGTNLWEPLGYDRATAPSDLASVVRLAVSDEDYLRVAAELQACADGTSDRFESEFRARHKDGSVRWRLSRGVVLRDGSGGPSRIIGTSVDVTRIKQAEEDLRAEKARIDLAAKLCGLSLFEYDVRGISDFGDATALVSGSWEERGMPGGPLRVRDFFTRFVVPEDLPRVIEMFNAVLHGSPTDGVEFRVRSPSGDIVRWRRGSAICHRDANGAPVRILGATYDIHEVKAAEAEARRAIDQLQLTSRLSGVSMWNYVVADGRVANAKPGYSSVPYSLGFSSEELEADLGGRLSQISFPEDRDRVLGAMQDCVDGKTSMFEFELGTRHKDNSPRWLLVRGVVTRDPEGVPLISGTAVDVRQLKSIQEELQRVRERLELAITGSSACTWDFELVDGQLAGSMPVFTNAWELCGYEVPEDPQLVGQAFEVVIPPDALGPFVAKIQAFLDGTGREWESELRVAHRDGTERVHLTRGVVKRDARGKALRFTGTSVDISASKLAEKALLESEERFRRTFENAAVGMIVTDSDGRFLEYNARFCEFLGYASEELAGRTFTDFMVPDEIGDDLERQRAVVRGDVPWFTRDKQYIRKDGARVWGNITVSVIQRQADGSPAHVMGILQDITERKELEAELERAQARMQLAIRGSDISVFDGQFPGGSFADSTWTHHNMWEPMGYDPKEVPTDASHVTLNVHEDDLPAALAQFDAAIQTKDSEFYLEHRFVLKDRSIRWRLTRGTFLFDSAGVLERFIGTSSDITRIKHIEGELLRAREQAESANRAKDEFLANVSHEIRTPMNAVLGMTELALDSAPSEHQRQLLGTVRSAAKNLLTIINDLLDFSKIASGKMTLDRADFSLRAAVGDTLRALAVRAHRKGLELLCQVHPDVPDALEGDAGRLRQVLMNLVGNAIKFTAKGEVEVGVSAEPSTDRIVALVFTVRDTGIGIARDKQSAIFNAFEQEDASTTRKYGGTGLGLTISAQLATLMDGDITVQSAPGCGSTFRFRARFARSSRPELTTVSPERLANLRVLVVDDNEPNRRILVEWLTSWRMQPASASNATEALAALSNAHAVGAPFSLVLLDARMPDIDGLTLAGEIRRRWDGNAPRMMLLSSDDSAELSARAHDSGVLAYLVKPVQQSELLEAIWAVMNLDISVPSSAGPAGGQPERSRSLRILVAEDNELNVTLLRELMTHRGHVAQFARDGRSALDLAVQGEFDLMLLDLHMPELDGFEVVAAIRDHERGTNKHLRIIALTARSSARDRERCLTAGMDEFLAKPIEADALWAMIDRLVADWPLAAPPPREAGLLDARAILRACGGQPAVLEKLRVVFRRTLPQQMARLRAALANSDLPAVREAAHQLVATVGAFSSLTAGIASSLEDAAVREDLESSLTLVQRLSSLCDALLEATETLTIDSLSL